MPSFKRLKSETFQGGVKELRKAIESMRSIAATPVEREFDKKWMLEIKQRVLDGSAVSFQWAIAQISAGSGNGITKMRINGQHSSRALGELLDENLLPTEMAIHLDIYEVADDESAILLFRQFDCRKSTRTAQDISGCYQHFQPNLRECKVNNLAAAAVGVTWYRREVQERPVPTGDEVYKVFAEERLHPFFLMVSKILNGKKANELKKVPVLAAAYGTWLENADRAAEFWRLTALGNNRNEGDAASDLDAELIRMDDEHVRMSSGDRYAMCVKAWKAFNDEIRVTSFKVNTKKKGLPVLGDFTD